MKKGVSDNQALWALPSNAQSASPEANSDSMSTELQIDLPPPGPDQVMGDMDWVSVLALNYVFLLMILRMLLMLYFLLNCKMSLRSQDIHFKELAHIEFVHDVFPKSSIYLSLLWAEFQQFFGFGTLSYII